MRKWYTEKTIEMYTEKLRSLLNAWEGKGPVFLCAAKEDSPFLSVITEDTAVSTIDDLLHKDEKFSWIKKLLTEYLSDGIQEYYFRLPTFSSSFLIKANISYNDLLDILDSNNIFRFDILNKEKGVVLHFFLDEYHNSLYIHKSQQIMLLDIEVLSEIFP